MDRNNVSLDFTRARRAGDVFQFSYDIEAALSASTGVDTQYESQLALPSYYRLDTKTLVVPGLNMTFSVNGNKLTKVDDAYTLAGIYEFLSKAVVDRVVSGNPVYIRDADAVPVKSLMVQISPVQTGSGDPSPDNIRPILGVSSVTVTRTGENGANPQSVTVSLTDGVDPLTVYGGTLNVTTGELTVTMGAVTLTGGFTPVSGYSSKFVHAISGNISIYQGNPVQLSNMYKTQKGSSDNFTISASTSIYVTDSRFTSVSDYNSALAELDPPLQFVYELATPLTYQLTSQEVTTLLGVNVITSTGSLNTVRYTANGALGI